MPLYIKHRDERVTLYSGATGPEDILVSANHDEHGWAGIDLLFETVNSIAEIYGIEVHDV